MIDPISAHWNRRFIVTIQDVMSFIEAVQAVKILEAKQKKKED